jgi:phosphonopyruvate decarboxylase
MLKPEEFVNCLIENGFNFYSGVPDSTFKGFMSYSTTRKDIQMIGTTNEGEACGIATGYHIASGNIPLIYMQNSGLGNIVNPSTSLMDEKVYSVPALLLIGWRGGPVPGKEGNQKDAPQHARMATSTLPLLESIGIDHLILSDNTEEMKKQIKEANNYIKKHNKPFAIVVRRKTLNDYKIPETPSDLMTRESAIKTIIDNLPEEKYHVISTTGKCSRELNEHRQTRGEELGNHVYMVGSMGYCSAIALGTALETENKVLAFDGDGGALMHMGNMATIGHYKPENLFHVIFDNNCHESTGGQPTVSDTVDFEMVAKGCGYGGSETVRTVEEVAASSKELFSKEGPYLLVVKTKKGARAELTRPTETPIEIKNAFMKKFKGD